MTRWRTPPVRNWAHQGGVFDQVVPNTVAAFDRAVELPDVRGVRLALECDVRTTADGIPVVHHDPATTNGTRIAAVRRTSLRETDPLVADLADLLERYPSHELTIEIKRSRRAGRSVGVIVAALPDDRRAQVIVTARYPHTLWAFRRAAPGVATAPGDLGVAWFVLRSRLGLAPRRSRHAALQVPTRRFAITILSRRFVDHAHRAGLAVHPWTINDPDEIRGLLLLGVDGVFTDRPDLFPPISDTAA